MFGKICKNCKLFNKATWAEVSQNRSTVNQPCDAKGLFFLTDSMHPISISRTTAIAYVQLKKLSNYNNMIDLLKALFFINPVQGE